MRAPTFFLLCRRTKPVWFIRWQRPALQPRGCCPEGMKDWQGGGFRGLTTLVCGANGFRGLCAPTQTWVEGLLLLQPP